MTDEMKQYAQELVEAKTKELEGEEVKKSQEKEVNLEGIFKSNFRVGTTLEQTPWGNTVANVREHNPENDLAKAYGGSPRGTGKKSQGKK